MDNRAVNSTSKKEQSSTLNERELLALRASQGDRHALRDLCEKVSRKVLITIRGLMSGSADVEDVGQNVLIRLCEKIGTLREPKAFDAWLNTIILNETRMHQRQQAHQPQLYVFEGEEEKIEEDGIDYLPQKMAMRQEEARVLFGIVSALPDRQREAAILHYYRNMEAGEVASAMGITVQTVYQLLGSARKKIKRELQRQGESTGSARLNAFAFLPIGPLVAKAFAMEEQALDIDTAALVRRAVGGGRPGKAAAAVAAASPVAPAVSKGIGRRNGSSKGFVAAIIASVVAVPALMLGLVMGGVIRTGLPASGTVTSGLSSGAGIFVAGESATVVFSGGDAQSEHLNPKSATVELSGRDGITVAGWEIADAETGEALYSGPGETVEEPFSLLPNGVYVITYTLEDSGGNTAQAYSNFQILRAG